MDQMYGYLTAVFASMFSRKRKPDTLSLFDLERPLKRQRKTCAI